MIVENEFNKKIKTYLKENTNSSASKTISLIMKLYLGDNYYSAFDSFGAYVGLNFSIYPVENINNSKIIGYSYMISYSIDGFYQNKETEESNTPMKLKYCTQFLAKRVLYRFMQIPNLNQIINDRLNNNK